MSHRIASTLMLVLAPLAIAACHRSEDLGRLPDGGAGSGGVTGSAGTAGPTGVAGTGGTTGSAGTVGPSGVAGTGNATAGAAGTGSGAAGTGGATGIAGTGGAGGTKATAGSGGATSSGGNAGSSATAGAGGQDYDCTGFVIPPDHPIAATAYEPTADTIKDYTTGLMWQRNVKAADQVNLLFMSTCPKNGLGGFTDWRLPTALELASIIDFAVQDPTISASAFPDTPSGFYGTATPLYTHSGSYWSIDFKTGLTVNGSPNNGYLRCVRKDSPTICFSGPRFRVDSKGSAATGVDAVVDRRTNTAWAQNASPVLTWAEAKQYCSTLARPGRLPTAKELLSLVDWSTAAAIDLAFFPDNLRANYWTSTPLPGSTTSVLTVAFGDAVYSGLYAAPMTEGHPVRCLVSP